MDKPESSYSPGKPPGAADHYPRGFYGAVTEQGYHDSTHGTLPLQVGSYPLGSTSVPRPSYQIPPTTIHPASGSFHHQLPSQLRPPYPQPTVGMLRPTMANQPTELHAQPAVAVPQSMPPTMATQGQFPPQLGAWMQTGTDPHMAQSVQQQQFQRLKVEDALSYLDQVKLQFSGHPQVYNDFLDIMKEFKSQSIDTPGVIKRVSCLFRGHPDLIVGFNTFLPPGYKIAVEANETISVEQPGQQAMSLSMFTTSQPSHVPANPAHLTSQPLPDVLPLPQPAANSGSQVGGSDSSVTGPPVEFNHAIQYVNKIKVCYQNQPDIYKSFLDILHKYQNEQKMLKEGTPFPPGYQPLTEVQVYGLVTELFKDQPQLLAEFSQFLPDASGIATESAVARMRNDCSAVSVPLKPPAVSKAARTPHQARTQPLPAGSRTMSQPPAKKAKMSVNDAAFQDPERPGDLSFVDRMRDELGERDYADLIQRIELCMKQMLSPADLLGQVEPMMNKLPELRGSLLEFLRQRDEAATMDLKPDISDKYMSKATYMVDLSTCKEEAVSYRLLPKSYCQPVCSGRSDLCNEVLNDTYALHASWPDDISSLGPHRKNQYEEHMYQCEDERYELDTVLELNNMAKMALMSVMTRLKNFTSPDDVARFRLDDSLGGSSEVLMRAALSRLYGEKTTGIIDGLKCNPASAVPIVLRRLVAKDKEWRTAQHNFHRIWREQNERYYLKSLDHQAAKFKQSDVKQIRSKTLLKEVETEMTQERPNAEPDGASLGLKVNICHDTSILSDAASLIVNHVRRQSALAPDDKSRVRHVLFSFVPDLLRLSMPPPPDLDREGDEAKPEPETGTALANGADEDHDMTNGTGPQKQAAVKNAAPAGSSGLFYGNDNWYYFLRLYMMLCDRLQYFSSISARLVEEETYYRSLRSASVATALKLRHPNAVDVCDSYGSFLDLVRSLLDGNTELSSFEDQMRDTFGIHAYVAFTVDKLIQNVTRQLQHIATKDICWQLITLYEKYSKQSGGMDLAAYQKEAEQAIADDRCFRVSVDVDKAVMMIEYRELTHSLSSEEHPDPMETVAEPSVVEAMGLQPRKVTFLSRNLRAAHAVRRKQKPDAAAEDVSVDGGTLPPVQFLNVESGAASLYTCGALSTAKQKHAAVSRHLLERFGRWQDGWRADRISAEQQADFSEWLLGHVGGLKADLVTVSHVNDATNRPPYRNFTKYNVVTRSPVVTDATAAAVPVAVPADPAPPSEETSQSDEPPSSEAVTADVPTSEA